MDVSDSPWFVLSSHVNNTVSCQPISPNRQYLLQIGGIFRPWSWLTPVEIDDGP